MHKLLKYRKLSVLADKFYTLIDIHLIDTKDRWLFAL